MPEICDHRNVLSTAGLHHTKLSQPLRDLRGDADRLNRSSRGRRSWKEEAHNDIRFRKIAVDAMIKLPSARGQVPAARLVWRLMTTNPESLTKAEVVAMAINEAEVLTLDNATSFVSSSHLNQ